MQVSLTSPISLRLLLLLICGLCVRWVSADESGQVTVFRSGSDGYNNFRIPAMVKAVNGDILAFCEARMGGDASEIDLVLKRSKDNGQTWLELEVVQESGDFESLFETGKTDISVGNPAPVVDLLDPQYPGRIWLPFTLENDRVFVTYSDDHGKTWADRREITSDVKEEAWGWYATGPVHSIQLHHGEYKGRLVVPCDHRIGRDGEDRGGNGAHAVISDDHGKTWRIGAVDDTYFDGLNANETSVVQLNDGRLYFNTRDQFGEAEGTRGEAYSSDGGETFDAFDALHRVFRPTSTVLDPPVVQSALLRAKSTSAGDDRNLILFSGPDQNGPSGEGRSDLRIRYTTDECQTWRDGPIVHQGPAAYSDMVRLDDNAVGILFEVGTPAKRYDRIVFTRLSLNDLELARAHRSKPTNVVLVLIDDLGWRDLGCYGSDYYHTPNIDRLAAEGIRFTDGYAACNVCSPTRAAILSGKYPARLLLTQWLPSGRWNPQQHRLREGRYISNLPLEEVTIAEAMREAGYRTAFIGKWHLGAEAYYYPEHQGFDINVAGRDYGAPGDYFFPFEGSWRIPTTGKKLQKESLISGEDGDYLVDRLAEEADRFIRGHADEPFFLMLSHYAVHTPLQAKPDKLKPYEQVSEAKRQGKPAYAAMVESVDESVGRVTRALRETGIEGQTLVIFTSDNGGNGKVTDHRPLRANKGSNHEGGIRVPLIVKWPGHVEPGSVCTQPVISMDFYPTILEATHQDLRPYQHLDGESLVPLLTGKGSVNRDALYWHYPHYNRHPESFPSGVIRAQNWKLIENFETGKISLYDLAADIGETHDLSDRHADKAFELLTKLRTWREEVGADMMRPNPQFIGE